MEKPFTFSLEQLRLFLAVADHGSFSAAARKLRRTQSSVSHAVAVLEQQLGIALFDRREWKPRLSAAGSALVDRARAMIEDAATLQMQAGQLAGGVEPEISLVVDVIYPLGWLIDALKAFRAEFSSTAICLKIEALGAVADPVLDRSSHFGIMGTLPGALVGLERLRIGHVQLIPVAAPAHPLAQRRGPVPTRDVAPHEQIVLSDRSERTRGRDYGVLAESKWRVADLGAKHALLRAGLGWGFMPLPIVQSDIESGALARLALEYRLPNDGRLPLHVIYRQGEPPGPAAMWLIERLKQSPPAPTHAADG